MSAEPFVSVIIPARDAERGIGACLEGLGRQDYPRERYEVIVVDDGSSDRTGDVARAGGACVVRIDPSGPAAARNRGAVEASGDALLFTDADCVPDPGWIRALVRVLEDPEVAAAKGVYRTEQRSLTARFVQTEYESRYALAARRPTIDFIDTYSAVYRRSAFERVGGFDESFPCACVEDQELGFRLARTGEKMVFCPDAVVAHTHAAHPLAYFRKKVKIAYWKMRVLRRYPDKVVADSHTPVALKAELAAVWGALATLPLAAFPSLGWIPVGFLGGFFAAGAPFCLSILPKNRKLAFAAPCFLLLRSVALGSGMLLGAARELWSRGARSGARARTTARSAVGERQLS